MKSPKDYVDDLRSQLERFKFKPDSVNAVHSQLRRLSNQFDVPGPDMAKVENFNIPNGDMPIPVRVYEPHGASPEPGPGLVYLHGGGFVTCSIDTHDGICRRIASGASYRVLSVEYRLAPEYPFPAAVDDCEAALKWVLEGYGQDYGFDRRRVALGGDSAGGNMTAYLTQKYRADLFAQILYYPLMQMLEFKPAKAGPQDVLQLGVMALKFIDEHYVKDADPYDTRLSPLLETDLKGIPPTYILTCGLDPLRHEGKAYAEKLRASGVKVETDYESRLPHGYLNFARTFPKAKKTPLDTADFLRKHLKP